MEDLKPLSPDDKSTFSMQDVKQIENCQSCLSQSCMSQLPDGNTKASSSNGLFGHNTFLKPVLTNIASDDSIKTMKNSCFCTFSCDNTLSVVANYKAVLEQQVALQGNGYLNHDTKSINRNLSGEDDEERINLTANKYNNQTSVVTDYASETTTSVLLNCSTVVAETFLQNELISSQNTSSLQSSSTIGLQDDKGSSKKDEAVFENFSNFVSKFKDGETLQESDSDVCISSQSDNETDETSFTYQKQVEALPSEEEECLDSGISSPVDDEQSSCTTSPTSDTESFSNSTNHLCDMKTQKRLYSDAFKSCLSVKAKRSTSAVTKMVSFDGVTVFYFPRKQGYITVPSQGGSTLGMSMLHSHSKQMTLSQHKYAIARRRRKAITEQRRQQRIGAKLKQLKDTYPHLELAQLMSMASEPEDCSSESSSSSDCSDQDVDSADEDFYLKPIPTKRRRQLLRLAGVQKIDSEEKLSNKLTRESREICGCDCEGVCLPHLCQCALAGIPCQVDRDSFPCGCVTSGCNNANGRVQFDVNRVRSHYFRTMRRIRMEETGTLPTDENSTQPPHPPKSPYGYDTESTVLSSKQVGGDDCASSELCADPETPKSTMNFTVSCDDKYVYRTDNFLPRDSAVAAVQPDSFNTAPGISQATDFLPQQFDVSSDGHFLNDSPFGELSSSFIVSEQNGFDYFVPQPVPCSVLSTPSRYEEKPFDTMNPLYWLSAACDDSASPESMPLSAAAPLTPSSSAPDCKGTFKLDPIATILPASSTAERQLSDDTQPSFFSLLEAVNQAEVSISHAEDDSELFSLDYLLDSELEAPVN